MRAGLLTETIKILSPTVEVNSVGEQITTYTEKATIKARNVLHRQSRQNDNGDVWMPNTYTLEVRIYQPIYEYDRIRWNGKDYNVISLQIDKAMMCKRLEIVEVNE